MSLVPSERSLYRLYTTVAKYSNGTETDKTNSKKSLNTDISPFYPREQKKKKNADITVSEVLV
jgi:hypothetical protein